MTQPGENASVVTIKRDELITVIDAASEERMSQQSRQDARRAHLATKSGPELREIAAMERVTPLDAQIADLAADVLAARTGAA